jgi:hypothetical protein
MLQNMILPTSIFPWISSARKNQTKKLKTGLIGRYPPRLEQKAEYLLSLVLVQADRVERAGNLTTPLQ